MTPRPTRRQKEHRRDKAHKKTERDRNKANQLKMRVFDTKAHRRQKEHRRDRNTANQLKMRVF